MPEKPKHQIYTAESVSTYSVLQPQNIANMYSQDWQSTDPQIVKVEAPFKLRGDDPNVQHLLVSQEYIVVRGNDPYQPADIWNSKLGRYRLDKQAETDDVTVFQVPHDLVTLSSIMNDAIDGNPRLLTSVFGEIGTMFRNIADAYADRSTPITSTVTIGDIAFIKGRKEPLLLPPFSLELNPSGESPAASLERDIYRTPLDPVQRQAIQDALDAFKEAYGNGSSQ